MNLSITSGAECADGIDNDLDGKTDFPTDLGCSGISDNDEADEVVVTPVTPPPVISGGAPAIFTPIVFGDGNSDSSTGSQGFNQPTTVFNVFQTASLSLNNDAASSSSRFVTLNLNVFDLRVTKKLLIGSSRNFDDGVLIDYQPKIQWDLCNQRVGFGNQPCVGGEYQVFVRVVSDVGKYSAPITTKINLTSNQISHGSNNNSKNSSNTTNIPNRTTKVNPVLALNQTKNCL